MSDSDLRYDRTRSEPPLTIERQRGPRTRGPAPVTLVVSLLLLAAVGGGVFYMYRDGVRGAGDAPQPLGVPLRDVREAAPPQPQTPDPTAGLTIAKDDPNAVAGPPTLAPPPEQPAPINALPSRPAPAPTLPAPELAAASSTPAATAQSVAPGGAAPPPNALAAKAANSEASTAGKPSSKVAGKVGSPDAAARSKTDSIDSLLAKSAQTRTAANSPAEPSGPAAVQIGAFSSEALAEKEWRKAAALAPGAIAGKGKRVVPLTKDGGTLYRTSITGFASRDDAVALCARLKAAGGSCFVR